MRDKGSPPTVVSAAKAFVTGGLFCRLEEHALSVALSLVSGLTPEKVLRI